jgi:hypothetical protein
MMHIPGASKVPIALLFKMEAICKFVDFQLEKSIYCNIVRQIIPGGERRSVFLVVTEFFIHIFLLRSQKPGKDMRLASKYALCEITKLDALDEVTFRITIGRETVTIVVDQRSTILSDIYHNLCCVQLPSALPRIDPALIANAAIDLFLSIQRRYRAKLAWQGKFASPDVHQSIDRFLKGHPRVIDLGVIEDLGWCVQVFLEAIAIHPLIDTILVPARPQSRFYDLLWRYFQCPTTAVTTLGVVESVDEKFDKFLSRLSQIPAISLNTLSFIDLEVSHGTIEKVQTFLNNGPHKLSLSFTKCDVRQCDTCLASVIENCPNIVGLHMTTVWLASSVIVTPAMFRLKSISLRGCDVQADEILSMMSDADSLKVEMLDLSKNSCMGEFKATMTFPPTLSKLVMDEVDWNCTNVIILFKLVCNAGHPMSFSCAKVQIRDHEWKRFFRAIEKCQAPLLNGLIWNENPVHEHLCTLLLNAPKLKVLCIAGSRILHEKPLRNLLESHKALYIVDMHGTALNRYGPGILPYLSSIKKSGTIRRIDVSHNKMGQKSFSTLAELIATNPRIRQVLCDDNALENYAAFEPLITAIQHRKKTVYVRFPEAEFAAFASAESWSQETVAGIKSLFWPPEAPARFPGQEEWLKLIFQQYPEVSHIEDAQEPPKPGHDHLGMDVWSSESSDSIHNCEFPQQPVPPSTVQAANRIKIAGLPAPDPPTMRFATPPIIQMDFVDVPPVQNAQAIAHYTNIYSMHNVSQRLRSVI